jgi:hypothetical protein
MNNDLGELDDMDNSFNGYGIGNSSQNNISKSDIKEYRRGTLQVDLN